MAMFEHLSESERVRMYHSVRRQFCRAQEYLNSLEICDAFDNPETVDAGMLTELFVQARTLRETMDFALGYLAMDAGRTTT